MTELAGWTNFFVITGSSAGALIGLQFVVITLVANRPVVTGQAQGGGAYATPTIVHFSTVLLLSAALSAPWHLEKHPGGICGLVGVAGFAYTLMIVRRMRSHTALYRPVLEDWAFHAALPFVAYTVLGASAYQFVEEASQAHNALFGVAAALLLLLYIGIHNAWDTVTYHVFVSRSAKRADDGPGKQG